MSGLIPIEPLTWPQVMLARRLMQAGAEYEVDPTWSRQVAEEVAADPQVRHLLTARCGDLLRALRFIGPDVPILASIRVYRTLERVRAEYEAWQDAGGREAVERLIQRTATEAANQR